MSNTKDDDLSPFMVKLVQKRLRAGEARSAEATRDLLKLVRRVFAGLPETVRPLEGVVLAETARTMGRWGVGHTRREQAEILKNSVMRCHSLLGTVLEELLEALEKETG